MGIEWRGHEWDGEDDAAKCRVCSTPKWRVKADGYRKAITMPRCPGVMIYWDGWDNWPEGLLTKAQLGEAGYNTGAKLPQPVGYVPRSKSLDGLLALFDPSGAVPKDPPTPAQLAALEKARAAALAKRSCTVCGAKLDSWEMADQMCHKHSAQASAKKIVEGVYGPVVVLDCETTDLGGEVIEVGVVDLNGQVLINQRIKPLGTVDPEATKVHGITDEMLVGMPSFPEVYRQLVAVLDGKCVVIYNADYDVTRLLSDLKRHGFDHRGEVWAGRAMCAMKLYAEWCGQWEWYRGDYRWQKMPGGDHSAVGDALATLELLLMMAEGDGDG